MKTQNGLKINEYFFSRNFILVVPNLPPLLTAVTTLVVCNTPKLIDIYKRFFVAIGLKCPAMISNPTNLLVKRGLIK